MNINALDVICLILIVVGVIFIAVSLVHRHKGMWNLGGNDLNEPWNSANPPRPHYTRRGIESPYDETQIGVELIILGLIFFVGNTWGLKIAAAVVMAVCAGSLIFNCARLRRMNDDDELRTWSTVHIIVSGFFLFFGALTFFLA